MTTSTIESQEAQAKKRLPGVVYRNIANAVSILGIVPLPLLLMDDGYKFVIPLMIYNNIMDDLDGILAVKLGIKSEFGCILDNVCDVLAHAVFVMVIAMHHGVVCGVVSVVAILAMELRVVSRLRLGAAVALGSPTNELVRHMLFILLLGKAYAFNATPFLIAAFILNAVSMIAPLSMPYLLRSMTKSAVAIAMINLALLAAWLFPISTPVIAACFFVTYGLSFITATIRWLAPTTPPSTSSGETA
jgi:phosphatidylglycerophosphate synthase